MSRSPDLLAMERSLWDQGYRNVAGVDEVGRGPFAGPVVAAAIILPRDSEVQGIMDSKKMTPRQRLRAYTYLMDLCRLERQRGKKVIVAVAAASVKTIDQIGILKASLWAMRRAVLKLTPPPDYVMVDGNRYPDVDIAGCALVRGDAASASIAAASIVAKVVRDRLMANLHRFYPQYGFAANKGYGTPGHRSALRKYGPTRHHRYSFAPVRQAVLKWEQGDQ